MSFNQSRPDNNSDSHYRKFNRSAFSNPHPRSSFPAHSRGAPAPNTNRSYKKTTNVQGGQSRVNIAAPQGDGGNAPQRNVQNGAHLQHPGVHGASDVLAVGSIAKQSESSSTPRSARGVPKAPTSQSSTVSTDNVAPVTPSKPPTDSSKPFPFQFGSISPGFMNGMQIPRTSSAPPNLDEQKRDQARNDALKPAPHVPAPVPKQQVPRKDRSGSEQPNTAEVHPVPKTKKDSQVSPAPQMNQTQKPSVLPHSMTSMPMSYHQPQVAMQFGGPNPQIQSQGVSAASLQMPVPMPLQMGNAPQVQQPVFVQGLQHHPMQPPGMMHQGQGLGFATQMGPQLPHQLGNIGIGMAPQYAQPQGGKFGSGQRKTTVKITDPKTHEELRLDKRTDTFADGGSSSLRSHPNIPPQSQPFASHPMNYYANSYGAANLFFSAGSSVPLPSGQMPPNPRFSYPVSQGVQNVSFMNSSTNSLLPGSKTGSAMHNVSEPQITEHVWDVNTSVSSASSGTVQVTVKPATSTSVDKNLDQPSSNVTPARSGTVQVTVRPPECTSEKVVDLPSTTSRSSVVDKVVSNKSLRPSGESNSSDCHKDSATLETSVWQPKQGSESKSLSVGESRRTESLSRSNSMKDNQKKTTKRGQAQFQPQTHPLTQIVGRSDGSADADSVESKRTTPTGTSDDSLKEPSIISMSSISPPSSDVGESKVGNDVDGFACTSPENTGTVTSVDTVDATPKEHHSTPNVEEQKENEVTESSKENNDSSKISSASTAVEPLDLAKKNEEDSTLTTTASGNEVSTPETTEEQPDKPVICQVESEKSNTIDVPTYVEKSDGDNSSTVDATLSGGSAGDEDTKSVGKDQQFASVPTHDNDASAKHDGEVEENAGGTSATFAAPSSKPVDLARSNSKKKKREMLQKADAQGMTSDLYMAYKGPEEKKEIVSSVVAESNSTASSTVKQASDVEVEPSASKKGTTHKTEPDDWEDAADVSTPKLEASDNGERAHGDSSKLDKDENSNAAKKYSRDFLLKFSQQFTDLPENFLNIPDIAEVVMSINISHLIDRDSYPSPGRVIDRSSSGSRMDRRGSGIVEDDRWSKLPGAFVPGRDMRVDIGYGPAAGFKPGQAGNFGVLRNPRAQGPVQYVGGILAGPMQSMGPQGGMQRNSPDAERWQRASNFQQKGSIHSLQTPLQVMHRAERKYEVGKVTDEEEAKQRQLKAILNKLTPQNFEKLFDQVKAVNIDNDVTLTGVIAQIFDKALMEPTFCEMYANFCVQLSAELPDIGEGNEKITFKKLLLNKCQEEFERGVREQEEANKADEEGEIKPSDEEREEKRVKARRRMLGNIRLIGELYKKKMLTERIMHACIQRLLGEYHNPDEEDVEALCKLMSTIGEMIDHPKAKEHMDVYFDRMAKLSDNMKLSSRVRFMLKDTIDLRRNRWQQRRKVEGPKKIEEVHRDAAQERQQQSSRLTRNPSSNISAKRTPMDFGPRGSSMLSPPNARMGSFRGLSPQVRGGYSGTQDVRFEERQTYDARLSVPLPQRPLGDESITLGPQGGLARGMSIRGLPSIANTSAADPSHGDPRRMAPSLNGFSSMPDKPAYGPREDLMPGYAPDRFAVSAAYDQMNSQERNVNYVSRDPRNADRGFDRSAATSPPTRTQGSLFPQNTASDKVYSEERLRDMSMAAIKEFYSARDEKEVALCIKDLKSPGFHPSMISLWVTDSFERKDVERDLLAKLLISLASSRDSILTPAQLSKGFESVLSTLEDAVNDAPKAPEFLGRIFAKIVLENVVPLREFGRLLHEGGEEQGSLLEAGLAGDVLGSTLEMIKTEKGETALKEIQTSSNLQLEDFRPPDPMRSRILEKFI